MKEVFSCRKALFNVMKVKISNNQEMAQLERNSHSKILGGKKLNLQLGTYTKDAMKKGTHCQCSGIRKKFPLKKPRREKLN